MKKLLFALLYSFAIVAKASLPEGPGFGWYQLSAIKSIKVFVNTNSIKQEKQILSVWIAVIDHKNKQYSKSYEEYNCRSNQFRFLSTNDYKDSDFTQLKSSNNKPSEWIHLPPDSIGSDIKQILCK